MNSTLAAVLITGICALAGSWLTAWIAGRNSARQVEQQERDADRERIRALEERDALWQTRCDTLWNAREQDAIVKRRQGDYIDELQDHIWQRKPPPPPPRPDGI